MYDEPDITYSYGNEAELFGTMAFIVIAVVIGLLIGIGIAALLAYFVSSWLKDSTFCIHKDMILSVCRRSKRPSRRVHHLSNRRHNRLEHSAAS